LSEKIIRYCIRSVNMEWKGRNRIWIQIRVTAKNDVLGIREAKGSGSGSQEIGIREPRDREPGAKGSGTQSQGVGIR
jgi:hypothetical protein